VASADLVDHALDLGPIRFSDCITASYVIARQLSRVAAATFVFG
jgi:hypothetical protein